MAIGRIAEIDRPPTAKRRTFRYWKFVVFADERLAGTKSQENSNGTVAILSKTGRRISLRTFFA